MNLFRSFLITLLLNAVTTAAYGNVTYSISSAGPSDAGYSYWNVTYTLLNQSSPQVSIDELNLYFDYTTQYLTISPVAAPSGWNPAVTQDLAGPGPGGVPSYDPYSLYNAQADPGPGIAPGLSGDFSLYLSYAYTVAGAGPSDAPLLVGETQPFQSLSNGTVVETGNVSAVPEPSTCVLLTISLGVAGYARKRMKDLG